MPPFDTRLYVADLEWPLRGSGVRSFHDSKFRVKLLSISSTL